MGFGANKQIISNYPESFPSTNPSHPSTIELSDRSNPSGSIPKTIDAMMDPSSEGYSPTGLQYTSSNPKSAGPTKIVTS